MHPCDLATVKYHGGLLPWVMYPCDLATLWYITGVCYISYVAVWRLSSAKNVKLKISEEATSSLHCAQHWMFAPCATQSRTDVHCQPWVPDPTAHAYTFVQLE